MELSEIYDVNDEARVNAQRERLEAKLLDAANQLTHFMGCSACVVPSRHSNAQVVVIGHQDDCLRLRLRLLSTRKEVDSPPTT